MLKELMKRGDSQILDVFDSTSVFKSKSNNIPEQFVVPSFLDDD